MALSFVLKPRRRDWKYLVFLTGQFFAFSFLSEMLGVVGVFKSEHFHHHGEHSEEVSAGRLRVLQVFLVLQAILLVVSLLLLPFIFFAAFAIHILIVHVTLTSTVILIDMHHLVKN